MLVKLLKQLVQVYFAELYGFCVMDNHFHLLVRMKDGADVDAADIAARFKLYHAGRRKYESPLEADLRRKWGSLSEFVKDLKQRFSRWYNRRYDKSGYFWSGRFKSVIVQPGVALVHTLAYIDLNPVRAGAAARPEDWRWCSLAYHVQRNNRGKLLSLDFGMELPQQPGKRRGRLALYRRYVYEVGALPIPGKAAIAEDVLQTEARRGFELPATERFCKRNRYFVDSVIIGSREFVTSVYGQTAALLGPHKSPPVRIRGVSGLYSFRKLQTN